MPKPRIIFDKAYKLQAVEHSYESKSVQIAAEELGIPVKLLYRWRSELARSGEKSFPGEGKQALSAEEAKIARLEKALADKEEELRILKKAIGIFSRSGGKSTNL